MVTKETELTKKLGDRFFGHPYTWDYATKCMYLFLDYTSRRARQDIGVRQQRILHECGMLIHPESTGYDLLRAVKISVTKTFGVSLEAAGNGDGRVYWYADSSQQREIRQFMIQCINAAKVNYLQNMLDEIPPPLFRKE